MRPKTLTCIIWDPCLDGATDVKKNDYYSNKKHSLLLMQKEINSKGRQIAIEQIQHDFLKLLNFSFFSDWDHRYSVSYL